MNAQPTLAQLQKTAELLGVDGLRSRWSVEFVAHVGAHKISDRPWLYTEVEVWRAVDQDYDQKERIRIGRLMMEGRKPVIALLDGLDIPVIKWIAGLCKERGVKVGAPPTAAALAEALRGS